MKRLESVSKIMSKDLITLGLSDNLYKAEKRIKESHIRHIPIVDDEQIIGMLSLSYLKRIRFLDACDANEIQIDNAIFNMLTIEQIMVKNPIKVDVNTTIKSVAEILSKNEFHALPIVDNDLLVGIVTTSDLREHLLDQLELETKNGAI